MLLYNNHNYNLSVRPVNIIKVANIQKVIFYKIWTVSKGLWETSSSLENLIPFINIFFLRTISDSTATSYTNPYFSADGKDWKNVSVEISTVRKWSCGLALAPLGAAVSVAASQPGPWRHQRSERLHLLSPQHTRVPPVERGGVYSSDSGFYLPLF